MNFNPGLGITPVAQPLGFRYDVESFGPEPELRKLDSIRPSLKNPNCDGPDPVYAIAMDVGRKELRAELKKRMLLFGVVTFSAGRLGNEPIRSQGHVHRISQHSGWSPPEVYEIWNGVAYVYMQEHVAKDPGRCYAILVKKGDIVVVPPGWAHATINAEFTTQVTFCALCDREYGFEYVSLRKWHGLAWYPLLTENGEIQFEANPAYRTHRLEVREPSDYFRLGLGKRLPLYLQAASNLDRFQWVSKPGLIADFWTHFEP